MPQIVLKHCTIADVLIDEAGERTVKINCTEEDFFVMLDSINPKNIVKYLDMRCIDHRESININILGGVRDKKKIKRIKDMIKKGCTVQLNE